MSDWTASATMLCEGLREQREIYAELAVCTLRQGEILLRGRTDEILELARAKESALARIEAVEPRIGDGKAEWPSVRDSLPEELRLAVQDELDQLHDMLRDLIALETEQQRRVDVARRETTEKLRRYEGDRRVSEAYGAPATPGPRFLDHTE